MSEGLERGGLCRSRRSPIDIEPADVVTNDGMRLHVLYKQWNIDDVTIGAGGQSSDRSTPRLEFGIGTQAGVVQIGTSVDDFDEYALTHIEVHAPSQHTVRHASWPVELQFWHEPLSQLRLPSFAVDVAALARANEEADHQLADMTRLVSELQNDTGGKVWPWAPEGRLFNVRPQTTLDWVDAKKAAIRNMAVKLKEKTAGELQRATALTEDAASLVGAQGRPFAAHRVAISVVLRRAAPWRTDVDKSSASKLVRWLTDAMHRGSRGADVGDEKRDKDIGPIDPRDSLVGAGPIGFFAYEGSLTGPPCTPDVRWFIAEEPLVVSASQLEDLLAASNIGRSGSTNLRGNATGALTDLSRKDTVLPVPGSSKVERTQMVSGPFQKPALTVSVQESESNEKWVLVQRYGKIFFLASVFVFCTPFVALGWRDCMQPEEEAQASTEEDEFSSDSEDLSPEAQTPVEQDGTQEEQEEVEVVEQEGETFCAAAARKAASLDAPLMIVQPDQSQELTT